MNLLIKLNTEGGSVSVHVFSFPCSAEIWNDRCVEKKGLQKWAASYIDFYFIYVSIESRNDHLLPRRFLGESGLKGGLK